jgi:RNA polymerase subunit RPABC4/transcription elongation factor Spt4
MKLLDVLFGCTHQHYTFPMSVRAGRFCRGVVKGTAAYVVCLDCGKEFAYDWERMQVVWRPARSAQAGSTTMAGRSETVTRAA